MARQKQPAPEPQPTGDAGAYTVLARRYRPQTFGDLVGQEPVARALVNALRTNRVAHAYLFTGARGVGKTSTARILAKALNCEKGPTDTPCGVCSACRSIATGEDVDVLEIDGASNRGIDEVREVRSNVQYRPARGRYKIYIIDEVHMLTPAAFNALLKTLEEPPPHVKFIFATTEAQKIPVTILSRCQRFDFPGIPLDRIVERLAGIVAREGTAADEDALRLIARRAGGSMRDAQSLLDQVLAFSGERLTVDQVHRLLGTAGDERIAALAGAALAREPQKALDLLEEAIAAGLQLDELLEQLIAYWRDLMVVQCGGAEGRDLSVSGPHRDKLIQQAKSLGLDTILAGLDVLSTTRGRLRGSNHGRTLVEMALVRLGRLHDLVSLSQVTQLLAQPRPAGSVSSSGVTSASLPEGVKKKPLSLGGDNGTSTLPLELTPDTLPDVWAHVLGSVGPLLGRSLEKAGIPAILGPNTLVLRFPVEYNQEQELCKDPTRVGRVEEALKKATGRPWVLRVEALPNSVASPDSRARASGSQTLPGNGSSGVSETSGAAPPRVRRNPKEDAEKAPLIKRALEVFGAQIVRVDDGFGAPPPPADRAPTDEES
jgi:DNA polymerase-3 subunit gamma/tau